MKPMHSISLCILILASLDCSPKLPNDPPTGLIGEVIANARRAVTSNSGTATTTGTGTGTTTGTGSGATTGNCVFGTGTFGNCTYQ